ncbi:MAG: hypothetical protein QG608_112, partial [Actinomycetota bacterium]|nr:hypothetical protein [Actinomycetota bacterium]
GIINRDEVSKYGYEAPPDWAGKNSGEKWRPTEMEKAVVTGEEGDGIHDRNGRPLPGGGCIGEADHELDGGSRADVLLPEKLANTAYERSLGAALVKNAFSAWSSCMREKGYTYSDPVSATNDVSKSGKERLSRAQVDRSCRERENTVGIWMSVEAAFQEELAEENRKSLEAVRGLLDTRLRNARRVLARR